MTAAIADFENIFRGLNTTPGSSLEASSSVLILNLMSPPLHSRVTTCRKWFRMETNRCKPGGNCLEGRNQMGSMDQVCLLLDSLSLMTSPDHSILLTHRVARGYQLRIGLNRDRADVKIGDRRRTTFDGFRLDVRPNLIWTVSALDHVTTNASVLNRTMTSLHTFSNNISMSR